MSPPPTAIELAIALRRGQTSADALAASTLERIGEVDGALAAFVHVFGAGARRRARAMDRRLQQPGPLPPFFGVPIGIKDIDLVAWGPTRFGARIYRCLWTPLDGPVVRRIRAGGFNIVGKLATSELAVLPVTETDIHPPCRNPWNLDHSPGGSSGGSAAAVAAGVLPIAHATDGGGSIRIPAAFCHLVGFKPSRGLLPDFFAAVDPIGLSAVNCEARAVEDAAAMLDVLAGRDRLDPEHPAADTLLARCRATPDPLRIRFAVDNPLTAVDPEIADAVRGVAARLEALGHDVREAPLLDAGIEPYLPVFGRVIANAPVPWERALQPATRWIRAQGRRLSNAEAVARADELRGRIDGWWGDADVWLTPTVPVFPPAVGAWDRLDGEATFRSGIPLGAFTAVFNFGGHPAASLPAGRGRAGLPIGAQLVGRLGDDARILALCRQLERAHPWRDDMPPVHATR